MSSHHESPERDGDNLLHRAVKYVEGAETLDLYALGVIRLPLGSAEATQCQEIAGILAAYVGSTAAQTPLSVAVFGPPGSGKSTFVREIVKSVEGCGEPITANLTQLSGAGELADTFKKAPPADNEWTRVFFFDEFDAPFNDTPLGWLRWFLAPMQDGELMVDGKPEKIGKAIFMFAGGTAESLAEFDRRAKLDLDAYRARKVPDFVSRLRGSIDIGGINGLGSERVVRRAIVLRRQLHKRGRQLAPASLASLLSDGYFVHGVRSMEAFLDAPPAASGAGLDLPDAIVSQHFSRGMLHGQMVGISAGVEEGRSREMLSRLTDALLPNGATLAYGGDFVPRGTLHQVVEAADRAPRELVPAKGEQNAKRIRNYLGWPVALKPEVEAQRQSVGGSVRFIELETITGPEMADLGIPTDRWFPALPLAWTDPYDPRRHVAWALSLFRMRVRLVQDIGALIVLGGKDDGRSWGRFAGIAEEVMIAIALRKPVYVLGGAGGAAHATGRLLGLDAATPNLRQCLAPASQPELAHALKPYAHCFQIPGVTPSPIDLPEIREFLYHRGVTTSAWPWNGLDLAENRELFACPLIEKGLDRAVELIVHALSRLDWKARSRQPN